MPGEFYFMALGGLGVSLAGFAGLIAALDRRPEGHTPVAAWRIRNIVLGGFVVTFGGFGTVALFTATGEDLALTVRGASLYLALATLAPMPLEARPSPAWPNERGRRLAITSTLLLVGAQLGNVVVGHLGYLQVLFLLQLTGPVSIFVNTVRDVARGGSLPEPAADLPRASGVAGTDR